MKTISEKYIHDLTEGVWDSIGRKNKGMGNVVTKFHNKIDQVAEKLEKNLDTGMDFDKALAIHDEELAKIEAAYDKERNKGE